MRGLYRAAPAISAPGSRRAGEHRRQRKRRTARPSAATARSVHARGHGSSRCAGSTSGRRSRRRRRDRDDGSPSRAAVSRSPADRHEPVGAGEADHLPVRMSEPRGDGGGTAKPAAPSPLERAARPARSPARQARAATTGRPASTAAMVPAARHLPGHLDDSLSREAPARTGQLGAALAPQPLDLGHVPVGRGSAQESRRQLLEDAARSPTTSRTGAKGGRPGSSAASPAA